MRRIYPVVLMSCVFLPGCSHREAPTLSDSAPATEVHYAESPDPLPALNLTPENVLCAPDVCLLKAPPVPVVIGLKDGAIIGGAGDVIQRIGPDGRKRFAIGGTGKGPGEYGFVSFADVDADGILTIVDVGGRPRRIRYDSLGRHISTVSIDIPVAPEALGGLYVRGHDMYLITTHTATSPSDSLNATLSLVSDDGRHLEPVMKLHCAQEFMKSGGFRIPFVSRFPVVAIDDSGAVYYGDPSIYSIRKRSHTGRNFRLTMDVTPQKVTAADIERFAARGAPLHGGPSARFDAAANSQFRQQVQEAANTAPSLYPVISRMTILDDRTMWVRRYPSHSADSVRWDVFSADAKPIGRVTLPIIANVYGGIASRVLIVDKDSLDLPLIRWYSVAPATK